MLCDSMEVGGAETHIATLSRELQALGCEVLLSSAEGRLTKGLVSNGIKFLPLSRSPSSARNLLIVGNELCEIIRRHRPDIVHAHTRRMAFLVHPICKREAIPLLCTAHAMFSMTPIKNWLSQWGDGTVAVSEDIAKHLKECALHPPKRIKVIYNGVPRV